MAAQQTDFAALAVLATALGLGAAFAASQSTPGSRVAPSDTAEPVTDDTGLPGLGAVAPWMVHVVDATTAHESGGDPGAINPNTDGAGLSFGLIQWNERSGTLGPLLARMQRSDPGAFTRIFGPSWQALLDSTAAKGVRPVGGVSLWLEPWYSRFRAAGDHAPFITVQEDLVYFGPEMHKALALADRLGDYTHESLATERVLAVFYDTAVQQGVYGAESIADVAAAKLEGAEVGALRSTVLLAFVEAAANRHRLTSPPPSTDPRKAGWTWRQVGNEWHHFVGAVDLYATVRQRLYGLLNDPGLSGEVIEEVQP